MVDRSRQPRGWDVVIVLLGGGLTARQLRQRAGRFELHSGTPANDAIVVLEDVEIDVWGVVTWSFRKQVRR